VDVNTNLASGAYSRAASSIASVPCRLVAASPSGSSKLVVTATCAAK